MKNVVSLHFQNHTFMSGNLILISLAILPVMLLSIYVYNKDTYQKEPMRMLFRAFFFGCLSVIPAVILEGFLGSSYSLVAGLLPSWFEGVYSGYVVAGCSEEISKLVMLFFAVWFSRYFDEYFDGIVYAAFVGLGFAGLENVMYVFGQESFAESIMTGTMRAVLSVPGHFLFAVVMGYYFSIAKFEPGRRFGSLIKAFLFPMLLHGTYDALLMVPESMGEGGNLLSGLLFVVFIYFDIKLWKVAMRRLRHLQQLNEEQYFERGQDAWRTGHEGGYDGNNGDNHQSSEGNLGVDPFKGFKWDV